MSDSRGTAEVQALSTVQLNASARRLLELLGAERFMQLPELIEAVQKETGHGEITIVVNKGLVVRLKAEKAY